MRTSEKIVLNVLQLVLCASISVDSEVLRMGTDKCSFVAVVLN